MGTYLVIALASMGGMGFLFALGLALADKKLAVEEDPKVAQAMDLLPGLNCGGCGFPGCRGYADAVVAGDAPLDKCSPGGAEVIKGLASLLGLEAAEFVRKVAVLHCQGGMEESPKRAEYFGPNTCAAATLVQGGFKSCTFGCLGLNDCVEVCAFDAIHIGSRGLPVVDPQKCTACGACVTACPRSLLKLHPVEKARVLVLCNNRDPAAVARKVCKVACIGCSQCVRRDPDEAVTLQQNLAVVNYAKMTGIHEEIVDKCPTKAIIIADLTEKIG